MDIFHCRIAHTTFYSNSVENNTQSDVSRETCDCKKSLFREKIARQTHTALIGKNFCHYFLKLFGDDIGFFSRKQLVNFEKFILIIVISKMQLKFIVGM